LFLFQGFQLKDKNERQILRGFQLILAVFGHHVFFGWTVDAMSAAQRNGLQTTDKL
jgi:hypothetical protein